MEKIIYENNFITIESGNAPYVYYFSDPELDWYEIIDLENTDEFIEFMDAIKSNYSSLIYDEIENLFINILKD